MVSPESRRARASGRGGIRADVKSGVTDVVRWRAGDQALRPVGERGWRGKRSAARNIRTWSFDAGSALATPGIEPSAHAGATLRECSQHIAAAMLSAVTPITTPGPSSKGRGVVGAK